MLTIDLRCMKGMEYVGLNASFEREKKDSDGEVHLYCKIDGVSGGVQTVIPFGVRGDRAIFGMSNHQTDGVSV